MQKMEKKIEQLEKSPKTINNTTYNTNVSNTNNIMLNDLGKESVKHLLNEIGSKLLMDCCQAPTANIPRLVEELHFGDLAPPENKNIKIVNKNKPIVSIVENGKWKSVPKNEAVDEEYENAYTKAKRISDKYCKSSERLINFNNDDERKKECKKRIELVILDNS